MDGYEDPVVFSNIPPLCDLLHVTVKIHPKETWYPCTKSEFQFQTVKARFLLACDEKSDMLAAPEMTNTTMINIICKRHFYFSGCLAVTLRAQNLQVESVCTLAAPMLEACILFTIIFRLAPEWNRLENYFIMGKQFLSHMGPLDVVTLKLVLRTHIEETFLLLHCHPKLLKLEMLKPEELDLDLSVLEHINTEMFFQDYHSCPYLVYVLPSFKRGRLVYVTNRIPASCDFKDYNDVRRHWKNTYGFRLPEEDSSMIYVGVNFFGSKNFLYPLCCVRKGLQDKDGQPSIAKKFVHDFSSMTGQMFGQRICLASNPFYNLHDIPQMKRSLPKWDEKNLLQIGNNLIRNFIHPALSVFQVADIKNNNDIKVKIENEDQVIIKTEEPETEEELFDNFIDGLSQTNPKRIYIGRPVPSANIKPVNSRQPRKLMNSIIRKSIFIDQDTNKQESPAKFFKMSGVANNKRKNSDEARQISLRKKTGSHRVWFKLKPIFTSKVQKRVPNKIKKEVPDESYNQPCYSEAPSVAMPATNIASGRRFPVYLTPNNKIILKFPPIQAPIKIKEEAKDTYPCYNGTPFVTRPEKRFPVFLTPENKINLNNPRKQIKTIFPRRRDSIIIKKEEPEEEEIITQPSSDIVNPVSRRGRRRCPVFMPNAKPKPKREIINFKFTNCKIQKNQVYLKKAPKQSNEDNSKSKSNNIVPPKSKDNEISGINDKENVEDSQRESNNAKLSQVNENEVLIKNVKESADDGPQRESKNVKLSTVKENEFIIQKTKKSGDDDSEARQPPMMSDYQIECLAKENNLKKANVPSLLRYLRDRGIKCNVKDKKQGLLLKAEYFLQLGSPFKIKEEPLF